MTPILWLVLGTTAIAAVTLAAYRNRPRRVSERDAQKITSKP